VKAQNNVIKSKAEEETEEFLLKFVSMPPSVLLRDERIFKTNWAFDSLLNGKESEFVDLNIRHLAFTENMLVFETLHDLLVTGKLMLENSEVKVLVQLV